MLLNWKNFRFNEVGSDLISCFKELRSNWKEKVKGIYEKVAVVNVSDAINLRPDLKEEIVEKFRRDITREEDVLNHILIK
jgi:hypothetical protein